MRKKIIWTAIFSGAVMLLAGAVLLAGALAASPAPAARVASAATAAPGCMKAAAAVDNAKLVVGGMTPGNMQSGLLRISRSLSAAALQVKTVNPAASADLDSAAMYSARLVLDAGQPDSADFTTQLDGFRQAQQRVLDECGAP
jgi:hypothetical protein